MTINLAFNDFEEMTAFAQKLVSKKDSNAEVLRDVVIETKEEKKDKTPRATKPTADTAEDITVSNDEAAESVSDNTSESTTDSETYSLEEVRAKLVQLTRSGKQKEVKALLTSFEAEKISDVKAEDYAAVMEKAGEL